MGRGVSIVGMGRGGEWGVIGCVDREGKRA